MTSTSGRPGPLTPESKLSSRRWRVLNSWWIFPPILTFGAFGWLGFMVAAIRTRQGKYWAFAALYAGCFLTFFVTAGVTDGNPPFWVVAPFVGAWIVPTMHAASWNRPYLATLARQGAWHQAPQSPPVAQPQAPASTAPDAVLGVSGSDYFGPASRTGGAGTSAGPLDVHHATVEQLTALPGVDDALAQRIVTTRDERGGYRDLDDLVAALGLQPHQLVRLRPHLTFGAREQHRPPPPGTHGSGRILDI